MGQTDRRTDGRTPDRYITLTARRSQCNKGGDKKLLSPKLLHSRATLRLYSFLSNGPPCGRIAERSHNYEKRI